MSKLFSLSLYHTSFLPLWISILFIDIKSIAEKNTHLITEIISVSCILISLLLAVVILLVALCTKGKEGASQQTLISVKEEKSITAEYLLSYILPLFAFDFTQWDQVVLFLVFYLTLGFLCVRHNFFSVNIMLELAHFRFYSCRLKNEDNQETEQTILSHRRLNSCVGELLYLRSINNEYKLDIRQ